MKANELLLWLSARREGSWWQFRAAVEELCVAEDAEALSENSVDGDEFPVHQQLRLNLERLAHVEFFAGECEDGWRVAPPTLAVSRVDGGWLGVLCGARSVGLRQRFTKASEVLRPELINNEEVPDVFRVYAKDEHALAQLSDQAGIYFQSEASLAILSQLPATDPPSNRGRVAEFPSGADWKIHEFQTEPLGWNAVQRHEANAKRNALFKFTIYFQRPRYFIRWEGRTYELPRAIGIYVLLRRRRKQVLRYDRTTRTLTLPAVCRPPLLLERALVLCCGLPPVFDPRDSRLTYAEVPEDIAQLTAQLLRQDLG
jgi:hypothetical protein